MKKSTLAVGIIVVLGIGYVGASWYTGNVIESRFDESIIQANDFFKNNEDIPQIKIEYSDYNKGIFSTTFNLKITELDRDLIPFNNPVTIYHGPFPWSQLTAGYFSPKMAALFFKTPTELNKIMGKTAADKPFITINGAVDYSNNVKLDVTNEAFNFSHPLKESENIQSSANKLLSISINSSTNMMSIESKIGQFKYQKDTPYNSESVEINNFNYSSELLIKDYPASYSGTQNISIDNFLFSSKLLGGIALNNIVMSSDGNVLNEDINGQLSLSIDSVLWGKQNLGKIDSSLNYKGQIAGSDLSKFDMKLDKFLWQTQQGDLSVSGALDVDGDALEYEDLNEDNLNFAKANINLPFKTLAYLYAQIMAPSQTQPSEDSIEKANQEMRFFTYGAKNNKLLKVDEIGISTDIYYSKEQNKAIINGEELNLAEFWKMVKPE